jgi:3D (Asp-Asp-Asp) domain-containing protein
MRVEATGYSPREPGLDFTTSTGARAGRGVIAVDPSVIPYGTRVWIPGYGYAVANDCGGAIKRDRIDLCFDTVAEAIRWGRRSVTIIILDQP